MRRPCRAGTWLLLAIALAPAWACERGTVFEDLDGDGRRGAGEPGLAEVRVSDGLEIVSSDKEGRWRLSGRPHRPVFVVKPAGFAVRPSGNGLPGFWRAPGDRACDFALQRREPAQSLKVIVSSDPQAGNPREVEYYARLAARGFGAHRDAALGLTLGDVANDDLSLYPALVEATVSAGLPWLHAPGNHDIDPDATDDPGSLSGFRGVFGPDTFAWEEAQAVFVMLDNVVARPGGRPAYSWLAPGFPAANSEGLKEIQKFDVELAKQLLAEAGFPDGEGFPAQELWLRNANALDQSVAGAIAASIRSNLGIEVEVSNKDQDSFMDALTAKPTEVTFGYVSYGMDFLDPFNMLSVWLSGGRHSWANEEFDGLVKEAASFVGDAGERTTMFQDAEKVLVEDVPGVFVYHETPVQLVKPWVKGPALEADANGITSIHWPGYTAMSTVPGELYISADAPVGRGDM